MTGDTTPQFMDVIVVGGVANGMFLRHVRTNAKFIKLARPDYIKPLESSTQETVDVERVEDVYEVHPISLTNSNEPGITRIIGIAVIAPQQLTWGFMQLVLSHVQKATRELREEALQETITH